MFKGIYVPVVTPFQSDGSLDLKSLAKLCDRLIEDDVAGIVPLGTTGESSSLDSDEKALVVETCAKAISGSDVELIVGVGTNSTFSTLQNVESVAQYDPDGLLLVTPYYVRPSEEGILAHFLTVADMADSIDADVMLYNIPARTGRSVSKEAILTAASHSRINGVKQAVGALDEETVSLVASVPQGFSVLSGDDAMIAPLCYLGGKGGVSATAHLATNLWVELVRSIEAQNNSRAVEIHEKLIELVAAGFVEPNPSVFKGVLAAKGEIESDFVRLPLVPAQKESIDNCLNVLETVTK